MATPRQAPRDRSVPLVVDGALALAVAVAQVVGAAVDARGSAEPRLTVGALILLVLAALPLAGRRVQPVAVLVVVGLLTAVYGVRPYPDPFLQLPLLIALATVAAHCPRRTTVAVGLVGFLVALTTLAFSHDSGPGDYYATYLTAFLALVLGDRHRLRVEHLAAVEARAGEVDRRVAAEAHQAASRERSRIAREMHDVVAHHVSMAVVQAEAGAASASGAPGSVDRFDAIAATGREALTELRRVLGVLRDDEERPTEPQPGLDRVPTLVAEVRDAGLAVDLRVEGEPRALPAGIDLSAYRIVQEALTNVTRHARGAAATVTVRYRPTALAVEVRDDGAPAVGARTGSGWPGSGQGLVGIRERVAMCGGTMAAGPRPGGGFGVAVELPLQPDLR